MSLFDRIRKSGLEPNNESNLTARQFLGKEKGKHTFYPNPSLFINHLGSLTELEFDQLGQGVDFMSKGTRLTGSLTKRTDRTGRDYVFPEFVRGRGTTGVKVVLDEPTQNLLELYIDNKIKFDFNMEQLIEEALKKD